MTKAGDKLYRYDEPREGVFTSPRTWKGAFAAFVLLTVGVAVYGWLG